MVTRKQLTTVGFGVPNLLKTGSVGYFPEEFIKDFDLQGMTALEIKEDLLRSEIDIDGGIIGRRECVLNELYDLMYYVNLLDNVFIKYDMEGVDPLGKEYIYKWVRVNNNGVFDTNFSRI